MTRRTPLTDDQIKAIRSSDLSLDALAERYGKSKNHIGNIRSGRTYKNVKDDD